MSEIIYKGVFGSHLYGTSNENSDEDQRQIHQDSLEDIILKRGSNVFSNHSNPSTKNSKDDLDFESTELREFIMKALQGQTFAMNMLFTPKHLWLEHSKTWMDLQELRSKLVTNNTSSYVGYCKSMAQKYSKKGDKLKELLELQEMLSKHNPKKFLSEIFLETDSLKFEHISIKEKFNSSSKKKEVMLNVVDSSYPLNRQLADIHESLNGKILAFGERSRKALENDGTDLKAYYHAFRVCWELEEILNYGSLKFPSKFSGIMLKIRAGEFSREFMDYWLTSEIDRVLKIRNDLPEPDHKFWDGWLLEKYLKKT